jgi:CDP-glucose 4,6-dehydratase
VFNDIYKDRSVLLTGHTGFKGSWLALWLERLGANVTGFSLPPATDPNHWDLLKLSVVDHRGDIRDLDRLMATTQAAQPEIVFHLAAQPLVRRSYRDPIETWTTNVSGTANVLEACRKCESVKAIVIVTTDKCYQNKEQIWGYRETDSLGGHDPYSASKAAAELVVASYRQSYFSNNDSPLVATARAGNVIGGGDWSEDRLIPDAARAVAENKSLEIRSPGATRPWQHVLESLSGYLLLGQNLLQSQLAMADAWNFGPDFEGNRTVASVLASMQSHWPELRWHQTVSPQPHETTLLQLDSTKAQRTLKWQPVWSIDQGIAQTAQWYHEYYQNQTLATDQQLRMFINDAKSLGRIWAKEKIL